MQRTGDRSQKLKDVKATFAERAKAARLRAGLTQQQLFERLRSEAGIVLDTSAITRIEAGQREPRLSEAIAIGRALNFGLDDLAPPADLESYMSEVSRLMNESREALVKMLQSVDPVINLVRRNPDCLGDDDVEDLFSDAIERFRQRTSPENLDSAPQPAAKFAITTNRADDRLKRQLLRAVGDGILVRADEIQPPYDRWFKDDLGKDAPARLRTSTTAKTARGRQHADSPVHGKQ